MHTAYVKFNQKQCYSVVFGYFPLFYLTCKNHSESLLLTLIFQRRRKIHFHFIILNFLAGCLNKQIY